MRRTIACIAAILVLLVGSLPAAAQGLERFAPTKTHGYPSWYQDSTGLTLEFCKPTTQAELDGGWCLILPADTGGVPEGATLISDEHFYWASDAAVDVGTMRARLILALEAAFANGPVVEGDQVVFGRLRIDIRNLPQAGDYTIKTPYGNFTFPNQPQGGRIFYTDDVGINCPANFECSLATRVAPFLIASNTPGGPELAPVAGPGGKLYLADPARSGPVTGSPIGQNFFEVVGPNGSTIGQTSNFTLMGRVFTGTIPGKVSVERASLKLGESPKLDIFANAFPTVQARRPGSPPPTAITPVLAVYLGECGVAADGTHTAHPAPGTPEYQMFGADHQYWRQVAAGYYGYICVVDETARNINGQVIPTFTEHKITDDVVVASAAWDAGRLSVRASSSMGADLRIGQQVFSSGTTLTLSMSVPPPEVTVSSTGGGSTTLLVTTGVAPDVGPGNGAPVATNDEVEHDEDTSVTIDVLANDTWDQSGSVTLNLVGLPRLGTAVVTADNKVLYTPNPDANGSEGIGYSISDRNGTSALAYIAIVIRPVNDAPVAVNDTFNGVVNVAGQLNVLANDTDVDGPTDLAGVQIVQAPANASATAAGNAVTFQAGAAGTYTFTYRAVDSAGAMSANVATVTVTVSGSETLAITRAEFITSKGRWRIEGSSSVRAGQTIVVTRVNGTPAGGTLGSAVVDAAGLWAIDVAAPLSGTTSVRATSQLTNATVTASVRVK